MSQIVVPTLGESVSEATVAQWLKKEGEAVKADEPIVELETDKAVMELPSPSAGTISSLNVKKGDTVVTAGGLIGKVAKVADDEVEVELAPSTKVRVVKTTLSEVRTAGTGKPANDTAA